MTSGRFASASTVLRGVRANRKMAEILWPRRETRRPTEKTNLGLYLREKLIYSTDLGFNVPPDAVKRHLDLSVELAYR